MSDGSNNEKDESLEKVGAGQATSVGEIADLYLGNILYAIERCAMSLESEDDRAVDAAFYRAIGRKLAEAHGKSRK